MKKVTIKKSILQSAFLLIKLPQYKLNKLKHHLHSKIIKTIKLSKNQDKNKVFKDLLAKRNRKLNKIIALLIFKYLKKSFKNK